MNLRKDHYRFRRLGRVSGSALVRDSAASLAEGFPRLPGRESPEARTVSAGAVCVCLPLTPPPSLGPAPNRTAPRPPALPPLRLCSSLQSARAAARSEGPADSTRARVALAGGVGRWPGRSRPGSHAGLGPPPTRNLHLKRGGGRLRAPAPPSARLRVPNSPLSSGGRRGVQCLLPGGAPGVFFYLNRPSCLWNFGRRNGKTETTM